MDEAPPQKTNGDIVRGWIRRVLPWALLAAAAWLAISDFGGETLVESGADAPPLRAELASGGEFSLEEHHGEIVVLNFWATWCAPCRAEAPTLTRVHNRFFGGGGGMVLGISADRGALASIAEYALGLGMEYPIARTDQTTLERFRVTQLPTTYVVSADGRIVWSHVGAVSERRLADAIDELL